jgi:sarcosine oxidase
MGEVEVAVVGAGMMGSAAARHLADRGVRVALIGPEEPADRAAHDGVFASHYDAARITRRLDPDPGWSAAAAASIARYPELERRGGRRIFRETGVLMAGPETGPAAGFLAQTEAAGRAAGVGFERLSRDAVSARFPSQAQGAELVRAEVRDIRETAEGVTLRLSDGGELRAGRALVACGAFSGAAGLLPDPPKLRVHARTVALLALDAREAARLAAMPAILLRPPDRACDPYILPPVRYPDGRKYLKIGGDPEDRVLEGPEAIKAWFRGGGDAGVADFLAGRLEALLPGLRHEGVRAEACATSFTGDGRPLIARQTERIAALTGGCGAAAKSADELGRRGALAVMGEALPDWGA